MTPTHPPQALHTHPSSRRAMRTGLTTACPRPLPPARRPWALHRLACSHAHPSPPRAVSGGVLEARS